MSSGRELIVIDRESRAKPSGGVAIDHTSMDLAALFEAHAVRDPSAAAVTFREATLSYGAVNEAADRLAARLIARGARPDGLVALILDRSIEMIIAMIAVAKSGAAYAPIDPESPPDRRNFVLDDAAPDVILTTTGLAARLDLAGRSGLMVLDDDAMDRVDRGGEAPDRSMARRDPARLAYVIYTSGSTGRPKGVGVTHQNVARLFSATSARLGFSTSDVWSLTHAYAFDFSVWEMWGALLHGGRLVVVDDDARAAPDALLRLLAGEGVTILSQTPSAFYALLAADCETPLATGALRLIIFGGEALNLGRLGPWYARHGDAVQLVNMYGITETTVHVTWAMLEPRTAETAQASLIGQPLPDLAIHLLDADLTPVPFGETGEIYVAGPGLARGYYRRPGLTAERFIACPFGPPGARMYRSGDLARRLPDGGFAFLGRADHQVKLRGFRIELGEIESALLDLPGVGQAAVAPREIAGETRLVAYVVGSRGDSPPPAAGLRAALARRLPDYMVPSAFVGLPALPLSTSGKLDRLALPAPILQGDGRYRAPTTESQARLCSLFAELTGAATVGVDDDFFALGGHSLLAVKLLWRVRRDLGREISLRELFAQPTPASLASALESAPRFVAGSAVGRGESAGGRLALSAGQRQLWAIDQIEGPSGAYNLNVAWRLVGSLDVPALGQALADIVQRHQPLRTGITAVEGAPVGVLRPPPPPEALLAVEDLADVPAPDVARRLRDGLWSEADQAFDLAVGPLLRARLFRRSAHEHWLALTIHHGASDGVSEAIVHRELGEAYAARSSGAEATFAPLPITYADHAAWLGEWLEQSGERRRQGAYWRRTLAGAPDRLRLPKDHPRSESGVRPAGVAPVFLDTRLTSRLQALADACGATLFPVLLAGWATTLARLAGQDDVVIGSPTAGRNREETAGLVGLFVNTLALRLDLSGRPDARELVGRARDVVLGALDNQAIPLDQVLEGLAIPRSPSHAPLFQAMFAWQSQDAGALAMQGLAVEQIQTPRAHAKFDLILQLRPGADGGLVGDIEFDAGLFDPATVALWARRLLAVLEGMATQAATAAPGRPVSWLPVLMDSERRDLLAGLGQTRRNLPDLDIAGTFERQAAATPDAEALVLGATVFTYRQLDEAADALAHRLVASGAGPEVVVAVAMDRSIEAIVAMLAILKAGGAYLPLAPTEPDHRLRFMLRDSGARLMVASGDAGQDLEDLLSVVRMAPLTAETPLGGGPPSRPERASARDALAYVVYTSGSTGPPKGVGATQGAVVSLAWRPSYAPLGPGRSVLQFAPLAFDAATFEIWGALLNGARLVLVPPSTLDLDTLCDVVREQRVDTLWLTAGLFAQAVESHPRLFSGVSRLLAGGDVLPPAAVTRVLELHPGLDLVNGYGPTEATTFACVHPVSAADARSGSVPIGAPIEGAGVLVLDEVLDLCPPGVAGELFIVGAGLARGYLGRPALTAERFIACPFGPPGSRMYRTGDLARRRSDGTIAFLGRVDQQVKVRGFRVEPGEIEAVLTGIESVGEAVVVPHPLAGEPRLVAYIVPAADHAAPDPSRLRAAVAARLPDYMAPAAYVILAALPLTANGKVDRRALPPPQWPAGRASRPAASPTEIALCRLFADLTGARDVGVDDSFFDLGGHSLLGVRLMFEIERLFGEKLPLGVLFHSPTPAGLSSRLGHGVASDFVSLVPLYSHGDAAPVFMIHWIERDLARHLADSRPVLALSFGLGGRTAPEALEMPERIEDIAAHYVAELRAFRPRGPYHLIGHSAGGLLAFEMARQLSEAGQEVGLVGLLDTHIPQPRSDRRRVSLRQLVANMLRTPPKVLGRYVIARLMARLEIVPPLRRAMIRFLPTPATLRLRLVNDFMYSYRPKTFAGRVWLFKSVEPAFHIRTTPPPPPELAWAQVAIGGVVLREMPGDHMAMVKNPLARSTADAIVEVLNELSRRSGADPSPGAG